MVRSIKWQTHVVLFVLWCTTVAHGQIPIHPGLPVIQTPSRLVDVIDIDEHDNQVNITLQFNCSLRYAGHSPASERSELRLRLRPDRDCGAAASPSAGGSLSASGDVPTVITLAEVPSGILSTARL